MLKTSVRYLVIVGSSSCPNWLRQAASRRSHGAFNAFNAGAIGFVQAVVTTMTPNNGNSGTNFMGFSRLLLGSVVNRYLVVIVTASLLASALVIGQERKAPPALTDVQRLQLQNISQQIEIAQLKAQAAQRDFDAARESIAALIKSLQVPGYRFDLSTLTYTPEPSASQSKGEGR